MDNDNFNNPPDELTFDQLISGEYGGYRNYGDNGIVWQYLLTSGWFYTGKVGDENGRRCRHDSRIDVVRTI